MQMRAGRPGLRPQRHDGGDIQPRAEPQFEQGKVTFPGPYIRHMAAGQKDSTGFAQAILQ